MDNQLKEKAHKQKQNESEMGSGESDDEFYNVKLPHTPTVASDKYTTKVEVKKVYSPPRTKVKYDYKFDSSSDDESEIKINSKERHSDLISVESSDNNKQASEKIENKEKNHNNLPQKTYKVISKINEELKQMKNDEEHTTDETENMGINQNPLNTSLSTGVNISHPAIGVVPPVVVMPPSVVVPQAPLLNVGPMLVTSPVGMAGPMNMMGMPGNILRSPAPLGNIMNPRSSLANSMMGINAVTGQLAGAMAMQSNILNIQGNAIGSQGNLMGLRPGMISPVGGMNMMLRLQNPNSSMMGLQNPNTVVGMPNTNTNLIGTPQPVNISGLPSNIIKSPNSGNAVVTNSGAMIVSPAGIMNNPIVGNTGGFMVMGGMMGNSGNSSVNATGQGNVLTKAGNVMGGTNIIRMVGTSPGNPPLRPLPPPPPPPPFLNRNRPSPPANFKWQTSPRSTVPQPASPASARPSSDPSASSPSSSPVHRSGGQYDGDELSTDIKEESDKFFPLEINASHSSPKELPNTFKNDGSFMEIFKKMSDENNQEASSSQKSSESSDTASAIKKPPVILSGIVGKRRGGRVLKTGLVKKVKKESETDEEKRPKDAWSMYMAEVKKYREASCEEEGKTRPLVK